jgi:hypothetical protein
MYIYTHTQTTQQRQRWVTATWFAAQQVQRNHAEKPLDNRIDLVTAVNAAMHQNVKVAKQRTRTQKRLCCGDTIMQYLDSGLGTLILVFATTFVLFGIDVYIATRAPMWADMYVNTVTLCCFGVLIMEWAARSVFMKTSLLFAHNTIGRYRFSFFFWLDLVAILSVIPDLIYWYGVTETNYGGVLTMARSGRAARIGAKIARIVRVLHFMQKCKYMRFRRGKVWDDGLESESKEHVHVVSEDNSPSNGHNQNLSHVKTDSDSSACSHSRFSSSSASHCAERERVVHKNTVRAHQSIEARACTHSRSSPTSGSGCAVDKSTVLTHNNCEISAYPHSNCSATSGPCILRKLTNITPEELNHAQTNHSETTYGTNGAIDATHAATDATLAATVITHAATDAKNAATHAATHATHAATEKRNNAHTEIQISRHDACPDEILSLSPTQENARSFGQSQIRNTHTETQPSCHHDGASCGGIHPHSQQEILSLSPTQENARGFGQSQITRNTRTETQPSCHHGRASCGKICPDSQQEIMCLSPSNQNDHMRPSGLLASKSTRRVLTVFGASKDSDDFSQNGRNKGLRHRKQRLTPIGNDMGSRYMCVCGCMYRCMYEWCVCVCVCLNGVCVRVDVCMNGVCVCGASEWYRDMHMEAMLITVILMHAFLQMTMCAYIYLY